MGRIAKDRASRLSEYRDKLAEWKETRSPEAARETLAAMRKHDLNTFKRATEQNIGELSDRDRDNRDLLREFNVTIEKKEQKEKSDGE